MVKQGPRRFPPADMRARELAIHPRSSQHHPPLFVRSLSSTSDPPAPAGRADSYVVTRSGDKNKNGTRKVSSTSLRNTWGRAASPASDGTPHAWPPASLFFLPMRNPGGGAISHPGASDGSVESNGDERPFGAQRCMPAHPQRDGAATLSLAGGTCTFAAMTDAERIEALLDIVDDTRTEVRGASEKLVVTGHAERRGRAGYWPTRAGWVLLGDRGRPFDVD
ncbi:hypothetical protein ACIQC9_06900 [Brevundimonas sp. NPDC092305]|uniref:hypothetical protein n=1 Tax=Brevundimonas sp. NPDC092305 TaxID=3363957 RepID=UPI0037FCCB05